MVPVMENHNPNTDQFIPAVMAHHRAMATFNHSEALRWACVARDSAPCDSEARRWATVACELNEKLDSGLNKLMRAFGIRKGELL